MSSNTSELRGVLESKKKDFRIMSDAHARLNRKLNVIRGMANLFLNAPDVEHNVESSMDFVMEAVNAEAGSIILVDPEKNDMYFAAARGPKENEIKSLRMPLGSGIAGASTQGKETIAVSDVRKDKRFSREIDRALGFETRSVLAVPLVFRNASLGTIEVINKTGSDVFTPDEIELVQDISRLLGALLVIGDKLRIGGTLK